MYPQKAVEVRRLANVAKEVDNVANWFVEALLASGVPEDHWPEGIKIAPPNAERSKFSVSSHHQQFACFYGHETVESGLQGRFELVRVERDGKIGDVVFVFRANNEAIFFADGSAINQYFVGQEQYRSLRLEAGYQFMAAIQQHLPKYRAG